MKAEHPALHLNPSPLRVYLRRLKQVQSPTYSLWTVSNNFDKRGRLGVA